MTLVFEFKYHPELKGLVFSSIDQRSLYLRRSASEKFVVYTKTCCGDCPPLVMVEDEGVFLEYDLRELPTLVTDATQLPPDVKRTDTAVFVKDREGRILDERDMLYLELRGVFYYVPIAEICRKTM